MGCRNCGSIHHATYDSRCKAKGTKCLKCHKIGHWAKVCRSGRKIREVQDKSGVLTVNASQQVLTVNTNPASSIKCTVQIAGTVDLQMTVDTGSNVSIIPNSVYEKHFVKEALQPSRVKLSDYSKADIPVLGTFHTTAKVGSRQVEATFYVVHRGSMLLGMDLISKLDLQIQGSTVQADGDCVKRSTARCPSRRSFVRCSSQA